ncbi:MAG TPA: S49 family peptidase [Piscirickettsiaceae bacterium]|nr:S49 family peptidase [Piscirickettsiaceae bacterium]
MDPNTEQRLIEALDKWLKQDRASRRWKNLLFFVIALYIAVLIVLMIKGANDLDQLKEIADAEPYAAVVRLNGTIVPEADASANAIMPVLRKAFSDKQAKAVIIEANSPGGSPVQAALINAEIRRLKQKYNKPVYVTIQDVCASGCYYVAVAADKLFANENSIVGSIGVRLDTFGFTGLMDKLGIENRSMYAGEHKAFINPFGPKDEAGRAHFREHVLERTHQQFIKAVREGRGERLKDHPDLFTGLVWLGPEATELGLIDGLGDTRYVAEELAKVKKTRIIEPDKPLLEQLLRDMGAESVLSHLLPRLLMH